MEGIGAVRPAVSVIETPKLATAKRTPFAHNKSSLVRPWIWREWSKRARSGHLPPPLTLILRRQFPYFLPWYNPVKEGSTAEALAYLRTSLAVGQRPGKLH
ncbi:MAG: hypothetical protein M3O62_03955 [Pseudomonadota bacterium]|nr:hypothetical protein [Pseudomonadota bacterium]